jgi:fucose 4-O-acetylase-like acetyltransferase
MGPMRVFLFIFWFSVLYWLVHKYENKINQHTRGILELLGRNSLFVYTVHAFIVFVFKLYLIPPQTNFIQNFVITAFGLALLVAITKFYKHLETLLPSIKLRHRLAKA